MELADDPAPIAEDTPAPMDDPAAASTPAAAPTAAEIIEAKRLAALERLKQKQQASAPPSTSVPVKAEARAAPLPDVQMPDAVRSASGGGLRTVSIGSVSVRVPVGCFVPHKAMRSAVQCLLRHIAS
jgi:hypothetical protein